MPNPVPARAIEARWPVVVTILVVLVLAGGLPDRLRLLPGLVLDVSVAAILAAMVAVRWTGGQSRWFRGERGVGLLYCLFKAVATQGGLSKLIDAIVSGSTAINGVYLLTSSIVVPIGSFPNPACQKQWRLAGIPPLSTTCFCRSPPRPPSAQPTPCL